MAELNPREKRNAVRLIVAHGFTKLGDVLANPKTVLTWMLSQLGAPGAVLSMLVPVRESGSMLPQMFISGMVKKVPLRKRVFAAGALAQAVSIAAMGACALMLPPAAAGFAVLSALALFATARAFCSISSKDVLGKTIPKGFRGRVGGVSNSVSGILSATAAVLLLLNRGEVAPSFLAWVLLGTSLCWVIGAGLFLRVSEPPSHDERGALPQDLRSRFQLVRDDRLFRNFVVVRSLLLGSALASPLLVVLAQQRSGGLSPLVGFVVASGVANGTSSFLWGRLADRSSALAMAAGGSIAAIVGGFAVVVALGMPSLASRPATWPVMFLLFNIGYAGVRLGRKTWVVDAAEGGRRTDYVSASNTMIATVILVLGLATSPMQAFSPLLPLGFYSVLCAAGAVLALTPALRPGK